MISLNANKYTDSISSPFRLTASANKLYITTPFIANNKQITHLNLLNLPFLEQEIHYIPKNLYGLNCVTLKDILVP